MPQYQLVFSHLTSTGAPGAAGGGDRLRIAGPAELNGHDRDLNRQRCEAIMRRTAALFPGPGDTEQAQLWTGLRRATSSNVPIVGRSKTANLHLNTRHGTVLSPLAAGQPSAAHSATHTRGFFFARAQAAAQAGASLCGWNRCTRRDGKGGFDASAR